MTTKKEALANETKSETIKTFEYKGNNYEVETDADNWPLEVILEHEAGKSVGMVSAIVGPVQWRKFMATKPTNKDFGEFSEKAMACLGVDTGE